jgi:hypothetical protein
LGPLFSGGGYLSLYFRVLGKEARLVQVLPLKQGLGPGPHQEEFTGLTLPGGLGPCLAAHYVDIDEITCGPEFNFAVV